ncbi:MAG: hypothetical protein AUH39_00355 [Chloroflexi bacterium 13_1_40CM_67_9]|nr:MAG: hypothetical protein AUH39_00355 [Chloroflexi bacterium 13_1_40CM_67_9]
MCAMLEYASIRFVFVCASATMFPPVIVTAARIARTVLQSTPSGPRAPTRTRRIAAKAAAFGPTDMNAVAGVGAPSYASGVHWWNGTIAALKPRPTVMRASATIVGPFAMPCAARTFAIVAKSVAFVTPYSHASP